MIPSRKTRGRQSWQALRTCSTTSFPSAISHGERLSQAFEKAQGSTPVIVTKNNTPTAVIISPEEYKRLAEVEENLYLLGLAIERLDANEGKKRLTEKEVMEHLGITEEDIENADEVEFE